ncbi:MAG: arsenite methyltransferase, partial [Gemmatimonadota bacterium]|jgi:SAM-dependent methyltransferase|nr:arsenite methyltransferase [Gemmatimonadota bacterium]
VEKSVEIGYEAGDLSAIPSDAILGLGCGNPLLEATPAQGEIVLDLGSGGGIDAFLAARAVGPEGRIIGVDMTSEMLERARANAERIGASNVEFREGTIEQLPVTDEEVDLVVSNCVINLSEDKDAVFREAFRVLKPGGRISVSDIICDDELDDEFRANVGNHVACLAGAVTEGAYTGAIRSAGFVEVRVTRSAAWSGPETKGHSFRSLSVVAEKASG